MLGRREFIQTLAGLPIAAGAVAGSRVHATLLTGLHGVLLDPRHPETQPLAQFFRDTALRLHALPAGDLTPVWLHELRPLWRTRMPGLAGLTERSALYCLEQLAWDCGARVRFQAEHVLEAEGAVRHTVLRPLGGLSASDLAQAGSGWPVRIAQTLLEHRQRPFPRQGPCDLAHDPPPAGTRVLTSWILA